MTQTFQIPRGQETLEANSTLGSEARVLFLQWSWFSAPGLWPCFYQDGQAFGRHSCFKV